MKKDLLTIKIFPVFILLFISLCPAQNISSDSLTKEEEARFSEYDGPEFRALWITRFEWPSKDPNECKQKIVRIFEDMQNANFNAAVFQVRGCAETLYPSKLEPWSHLLDAKDPGFDPLAFALDEAHKRGIQLHAYINPMPLFLTKNKQPSPDHAPNHLFFRHGPDSNEPWVCCDQEGNLMNAKSAGYWYLSPGIPEVHKYLREVVRDLVTRYEIDGIHLDRIRYPGKRYSHDPISEERFLGRGNPNRLEWANWQREQLDKLINDLYAEVKDIRPGVAVSCAAWGIYNRYHIKGYYNFSSGYHDYYQDTWNWIRLGAMDYLMPMIYWDIPESKPNYHELIDDFVEGVGKDCIVGGQRTFKTEGDTPENVREILYGRKKGIAGSVLFAYGGVKQRGLFDILKKSLYKTRAAVPELKPHGRIILGTVTDEKGRPVKDAWVSLEPQTGDRKIRRSPVFRKTWPTSADGRFAFLKIPPVPVQLRVEYSGASPVVSEFFQLSENEIKTMEISIPGAGRAAMEPFLHIFSPEDKMETSKEVVHLLGRTLPENRITVNGEESEVYSTGAFAADNIPLEKGKNEIRIELTAPDGETSKRILTILRKEKSAPEKMAKEFKLLEPSGDMALLPGDTLEIKIQGPSGKRAWAKLETSCSRKIELSEIPGDDEKPSGIYRSVFRVPTGFPPGDAELDVYLEKGRCFLGIRKTWHNATCRKKIEIWDPSKPRVGETTEEGAAVTFGTHYVRLGGPYLAELPTGARFELIGKHSGRYRIRLSDSLSGWVNGKYVKLLPENTPVPNAFFTYCIINGDETCDKLWIPIKEPVVFSIVSETEPENCLFVDFFDTFYSTTWFSHKTGAKVIGTVTGEQIEDGRYRLKVPIKSKQIWGYWVERDDSSVTICVKRPPGFADPPASPLEGIKFALEAGHGGRNLGAVGIMGINEKTVNLNAVRAVRKQLEEKGANVVEVRPGDAELSLESRVRHAIEAGADFYLSIHANAAGTSRGFLRVSGTSTYYKEKFCRDVAKIVYDKLLGLGWDEFGVVGNFNYYPLRETRFPSMLIEQAFMSHPGDEARLLDPAYQKKQAEVIVEGLEEFFENVRE